MTRQRGATYYLAWFTRCYQSSETGWHIYQTADGRPIMNQDAFFHQSLEVIASTMNLMIQEEHKKAMSKR